MRNSRFVRYAPKAARFLLTTIADNLPNARRLLFSAPLSTVDGGDGGDYTVSVDAATADARGVVKLAGQLGGTADSPDVRGVRVLVGGSPTLLAIGEVADGQVLARSGSGLVGVDSMDIGGGTMDGPIDMANNAITGLPDGQVLTGAATYGQLTSMMNGLSWQDSVKSRAFNDPDDIEPAPGPGDRYLVPASPAAVGPWSGHEKDIAVRGGGSSWGFITPTQGFSTNVEDEGTDLNFNAGNWVNMGSSISHGALMGRAAEDAHSQYQLGSEKDDPLGYAGLDVDGFVFPPVCRVRAVGGGVSEPNAGDVWVQGRELKFHDAHVGGNTRIVLDDGMKDVSGGVAGLDSGMVVNKPVRKVVVTPPADPPPTGDFWIDATDMKYRDAGTPTSTTRTLLHDGMKGASGGVAPLVGTRVPAANAPVKDTYSTGGDQALTPADIGAVSSARNVDTGTGLAGGGHLGMDREISIAAFSGILAKDLAAQAEAAFGNMEVKNYKAWDAGADGQILPISIVLPPCEHVDLRTGVVLMFQEGDPLVIENDDPDNPLALSMQELANTLSQNDSGVAHNNGRCLKQILLGARNTTSGTVSAITIGPFKVRAFVFPRGEGDPLPDLTP